MILLRIIYAPLTLSIGVMYLSAMASCIFNVFLGFAWLW